MFQINEPILMQVTCIALYTFADPHVSENRQYMPMGYDPLYSKSRHHHIPTRRSLPWHNRFFRQYIGRNDWHLGSSEPPPSLIHL